MSSRVLVVDDEKGLRLTFAAFLEDEGFEVFTADSLEDALAHLEEGPFDLILADILLGDRSGTDLLKEVKRRNLGCPVVMVTGYPNLDSASEAVRLGAFDYLSKPVTKKDLLQVAGSALKYKRVRDQRENYRTNLEAVFRSVKDGIVSVDREGRITAANKAARRICHLSSQAVGKLFEEELADSGGRIREALQRTLRKQTHEELARHECRFGDSMRHVITLTTTPLVHPSGEFLGAVAVLRDDTRLDELERHARDRRSFHGLIGKSEKMQQIYDLIQDLADVPTTVLVLGESGTGKELIAGAIHDTGIRQGGPLVKVNCAALADNLLESELFGHVRGAFTGAIRDRVGRFQKASGGTIFLDEIGDISPQMQVRLLRVLQEKQIERIGESRPIAVDVRVVAATNQDLKAKVAAGEFREDLFYRLKVVTLQLPPLRDRREDIPLLVEHFRRLLNRELGKEIQGVSQKVQELFLDYDWPGNIRELRHTLEHAFIRCHDPVVSHRDLPPDFALDLPPRGEGAASPESLERQRLLDALQASGWNKSKAARKLGMDRKTLYRKTKKLQIFEPT